MGSDSAFGEQFYTNENDHMTMIVPYVQAHCLCGGSLDTGFRCMRCGKQYKPAPIIDSTTIMHSAEETLCAN